MRKFLLLWMSLTLSLSACIFGTADLQGQEGVEALHPSPGFLWEVDKQGAKSYLFGTIHAGVNAESELPSYVGRALNASSCFVMESDPSQMSTQELLEMSRLPAGTTLDMLLTKPKWEKLSSKLHPALPNSILKNSQPWFAAMLYLQRLLPPGASMDQLLLDRAKAQDKKIVPLETWRDAIAAFAKAIDFTDLNELLNNEDKFFAQNSALIRAYRTGDSQTLLQLMQDTTQGQASAQNKLYHLLTERNKVWLPRLEQTLAGGGCFVAVGAGHLIGKDNLLDMLSSRDFIVRRVLN